jgi:hypothetical protein
LTLFRHSFRFVCDASQALAPDNQSPPAAAVNELTGLQLPSAGWTCQTSVASGRTTISFTSTSFGCTSIIQFHSSILSAERGESGVTPALSTMTSILPNAASAKSANAFHVIEVGDVERPKADAAAPACDLACDADQLVCSNRAGYVTASQ